MRFRLNATNSRRLLSKGNSGSTRRFVAVFRGSPTEFSGSSQASLPERASIEATSYTNCTFNSTAGLGDSIRVGGSDSGPS